MAELTLEKTNFTIKMDKETRDAFSSLCGDIGISMSAGVNALVKQAVRDQGMSFSLLDSNGLTREHATELKRRVDDIKAGYAEVHELIEE